ISRAYTGKTCRVMGSEYTNEFEASGAKAEPFPMQYVKSLNDGVNHLGGDAPTEGVDPDREFFPPVQGAGVFDVLDPAAGLVRPFAADAQAVIDRLTAVRA